MPSISMRDFDPPTVMERRIGWGDQVTAKTFRKLVRRPATKRREMCRKTTESDLSLPDTEIWNRQSRLSAAATVV